VNGMSSLGPYASFIIAAYALVGAVVLMLVAWVMLDYRRVQRQLRDLEASGATRRSGRGAADLS
jgi:heme exporter protein D